MELLTRKEASEFLKVSIRMIDYIINEPNFTGKVIIGRRVLIKKDELINFVNNHCV